MCIIKHWTIVLGVKNNDGQFKDEYPHIIIMYKTVPQKIEELMFHGDVDYQINWITNNVL